VGDGDPARRLVSVPAPRKYDAETRERAVRLYAERLRDHPGSKLDARRHVGQLLDINPATLRNWVDERDTDHGRRSPREDRDGEMSVVSADQELRALRREVAELRRANEILKTASAFFAQAELDRRLK
jgi:transposase-like protein